MHNISMNTVSQANLASKTFMTLTIRGQRQKQPFVSVPDGVCKI